MRGRRGLFFPHLCLALGTLSAPATAWALPDLQVGGVSLRPARAATGAGTVEILIENAGPDATGATLAPRPHYLVRRAGAICATGVLSTHLGPGETSTVSTGDCNPATAGSYELEVQIDTTGAIDEADETNNTRFASLTWRLPDGAACDAVDPCASGFCVDGVCCNRACGGSATDDCRACSVRLGAATDGQCGPLRADFAPTVVCRAADGPCDVEERCAGGRACPADGYATGLVCRGAAGPCDLPEACDGSGPSCPFDVQREDGAACDDDRVCNGAERCLAGACVGGAPLACDDDDPCSADMCMEPAGCAHEPLVGCGDAGTADAGPDGGHIADAGAGDAGPPGRTDAGDLDAGDLDAGDLDAGDLDAGARPLDASSTPGPDGGGCTCRTTPGSPLAPGWVFVLAGVVARRRRRPEASARGPRRSLRALTQRGSRA